MIFNTVSKEEFESVLGGLKFIVLTQTQYDALQTKDENTLYIING